MILNLVDVLLISYLKKTFVFNP